MLDPNTITGGFYHHNVLLQERISTLDGHLRYMVHTSDWDHLYGEQIESSDTVSIYGFIADVRRKAIRQFEENGLVFEESPK